MGYGYLVPAKKMRLALLPALLALTWPAGGAWAQACSLKLLNSVPLTVTDNFVTVPASVGTKEKLFQIGTAAPDNQMGKDAVAEFGLRAFDFVPARNDGGAEAFSMGQAAGADINGAAMGRSYGTFIGMTSGNAIAIYNAKGTMFHSAAEAAPFTLGSMRTDRLPFVVTDIPNPGSGGILSAGFFQKYDIDLNFAARRFNMFAPDHCKSEVLYWRAPGVDKLPFRYRNGQIIVRVTIDGRPMDAAIDTGSPRSELQFDDVDSFFYLSANKPGGLQTGNGYVHDFGVLSFGTVAIYHPYLVWTHSALARGADSGPQTGTLLRNSVHTATQPALTIGTDLLKLLHIYIAFKERMIYVTQGPELPEGDVRALPVVAVTPARP